MAGGFVLVFAICEISANGAAHGDSAGVLDLSRPAAAMAPAVRGEQVRTRPLPTDLPCGRVAVIGDSLMDNARPYLAAALDRAELPSVIDAQPSRRIPESMSPPYSGVRAVRQVRSTWGEADCWVLALGSNDLIAGGGDSDVAAGLIVSLRAAVTPGSRVWWVNLDYHLDPRWSFDMTEATRRFNEQLARAEQDGLLTVIDWYSLAEAHREWFFDPVHVNTAGSRARAQQVVDAITR